MKTTATASVTNEQAPKTQIEIVTHNDKRFSVYWLDEQTLLESELSNSEVN